MKPSINQEVAKKLLEFADLLEQQDANRFRIGAYRRAADTISALKTSVQHILEEKGLDGLVALPNIGEGIARAVDEMIRSGRWSQLDRLRGSLEPARLFMTVPGIGKALAERIHDTLSVDTLEALEVAAYDGRLQEVSGIGLRRIQMLRAALAEMLSRRLRIRPIRSGEEPSVDLVLGVDREYRQKAESGRLPTIAPRRFNPSGEAWLPILHTQRNEWHFTALYSNTAHAHQLGRTRDWVVIYFYDGHHRESQRTVVTEARGPLIGKRVVRGREAECRNFYMEKNPNFSAEI
jgi:putative hydrolase